MTEKPDWALQILNAEDLERQAAMLRQEAHDNRCQARESGGEQCTADAYPPHAHRINPEDMPC